MNSKILSLFLLLGLLGSIGCSSSKTKTTDTNDADIASTTSTTESSADAVGSIPEDILAAEEGQELPAAAEDSIAEDSTVENSTSDPFADLNADTTESSDPVAAMATESSALDMQAESSSMDTYVVNKGDTLMKIAFSLYGDLERWKDIYEWNKDKVKNGNMLSVGMRLQVENNGDGFQPEVRANSYVIKKGDTLANIADEVYGRSRKYKKLQNYNSSLIKNPHVIFAGFTLYYDITPQEMAEAEARRKERMAAAASSDVPKAPANHTASGADTSMPTIPSAVNPPTSTPGTPPVISVMPPISTPSDSGGIDIQVPSAGVTPALPQ